MTDPNPRDPKERRDNTPAVAYGLIFGSTIGVVVFAVTQNPIWIAIGPGIGMVVGAAFQTNRR